MLLFRSLLFHLCFNLNTILHMIICLPILLLPRRYLWKAVHSWARINHWLLRTICGTRFEIRGREHIAPGALLVAAKHQSAWETFALILLLDDPVYVLKRELVWLPIFGLWVAKAEMIPIQRGAGGTALGEITERAKAEIARGRQIVMFPEGTRRAAGAEPAYKFGVVRLYAALGVRCLPGRAQFGRVLAAAQAGDLSGHDPHGDSPADRARALGGCIPGAGAGRDRNRHRTPRRPRARGAGNGIRTAGPRSRLTRYNFVLSLFFCLVIRFS